MALSLRQIRGRIRSVENIGKITRAMEMVSSAKVNALQKRFSAQRDYFQRIEKILNNVASSFEEATHKLFLPGKNKQKILLCVVTSDTGLCGSYNSSVINTAERFISENAKRDISLVAIGKKGFNHFKKSGLSMAGAYTDLYSRYSPEACDKITNDLIKMFLSGEAGEVWVIYTYFESLARHKPAIEKILNIEKGKGITTEYLTEPDAEAILDSLIPLYVINKIRTILLSAFTTEQATRVMAMHEATVNARELLDSLTTTRNKMRQAQITGEIIEIISSAGALKG